MLIVGNHPLLADAENTCMLSDIPDERETLQTGQGQMERQNTETAGY